MKPFGVLGRVALAFGLAASTISAARAAAPAGVWDNYNLSPATRTVRPIAVLRSKGLVSNPSAMLRGKQTRLRGAGSFLTVDFGKEVGGFVQLRFSRATQPSQTIGLTFAESASDVDPAHSDASSGGANEEAPIEYSASPGGSVDTRHDRALAGRPGPSATPETSLRGGFRYLTIVNRTGGDVVLTGASVQITFAPQMANLRSYRNYFHSNDQMINRVWYGGAFTVQTNMIASDQGRIWPPPAHGWSNGAKVGETGGTVLVDGAKRDRTVWPGDLGISIPTLFASIGDMLVARDSLQTLYNHQNAAGALPYAGPVVNPRSASDTYHLWSLIETADYYQYTADKIWLDAIWPRYQAAVSYIVNKIGVDGLLDVKGANDWGRQHSAGKQIEAQAILYRALKQCSGLAKVERAADLARLCETKATALKAAVATGGYWDASAGLYRNLPDGPSAALYPQDGNALAIWFDLVDSAEKGQAISAALAQRWSAFGAVSPERGPNSIHPFPGSMEVFAHFIAGEDKRALDLIRREWGYMLKTPQGTASTFWEGFRTDGSSDYNGSYQSLAHAWSSGPTAALTFCVLGIRPEPVDGDFSFVPHPGDLRRVEGQLETPRGLIRISYRSNPTTGSFSARYSAPRGALAFVSAPTFGHSVTLLVDGRPAPKTWIRDGYIVAPASPGEHSLATRRSTK